MEDVAELFSLINMLMGIKEVVVKVQGIRGLMAWFHKVLNGSSIRLMVHVFAVAPLLIAVICAL